MVIIHQTLRKMIIIHKIEHMYNIKSLMAPGCLWDYKSKQKTDVIALQNYFFCIELRLIFLL